MTTYLEIVSEGPTATDASAQAALRVGPDYVVGGTGREETARLLAGSGIGHLPYVGRVVGHPRRLRGTVEEISADAAAATAQPGVDGITLLVYRYDGDVERLVEAVMGATSAPVLCAGSIDSPARIALLRRHGVWGFTIGTAILDGTFQRGRSFIEQLQAAVDQAGDDEAPSGV